MSTPLGFDWDPYASAPDLDVSDLPGPMPLPPDERPDLTEEDLAAGWRSHAVLWTYAALREVPPMTTAEVAAALGWAGRDDGRAR